MGNIFCSSQSTSHQGSAWLAELVTTKLAIIHASPRRMTPLQDLLEQAMSLTAVKEEYWARIICQLFHGAMPGSFKRMTLLSFGNCPARVAIGLCQYAI